MRLQVFSIGTPPNRVAVNSKESVDIVFDETYNKSTEFTADVQILDDYHATIIFSNCGDDKANVAGIVHGYGEIELLAGESIFAFYSSNAKTEVAFLIVKEGAIVAIGSRANLMRLTNTGWERVYDVIDFQEKQYLPPVMILGYQNGRLRICADADLNMDYVSVFVNMLMPFSIIGTMRNKAKCTCHGSGRIEYKFTLNGNLFDLEQSKRKVALEIKQKKDKTKTDKLLLHYLSV